MVGALGLRLAVPVGPAGLTSWLEKAPPIVPDPVVFGAMAAVGALTVAGVWTLGRRLGLDRWAAGLGALTLAISPAHVRFSHTDSLAIPAVALLVWGLAALARPRGAVDRVAGGLALGAAAALRPEGAWALPLALALRPALGARWTRADAPALVGLLGLLGAVRFVGPVAPAPIHWLAWAPPWAAIPVGLGTVLVAVAPTAPGRLRAWLLGWLALTTLGACLGPTEGLATIEAQLVTLPAQALATGIGLAWIGSLLAARSRALAVGAALLATALLAPTAWQALRPPTVAQEYAFVAKQLRRVDRDCVILARLHSEGPVLGPVPPTRLSAQRGYGHTWIDLEHADQPLGGCQVWYRGATCYAEPTDPGPVDEPADLPLNAACARLERGLNPRPLTLAHVGGASHSVDHYPPRSRMQLGFYRIDVPVDPSIPVPSAPLPEPDAERVAADRAALTAQLEALPPWTAPAGWTEAGLGDVLRSDPTCSSDAVRCSSDLCVAISTDPGCDRSVWHATTRTALGQPLTRFTWADTADGYTAVAVALVPESSRTDADVLSRVNALARLLLRDALYE